MTWVEWLAETMKLPNRQRLARLSRDRSFLVKAGLMIAVAAVVLGLVIGFVSKENESFLAKLSREAEAASVQTKTFDQLVWMVRRPTALQEEMWTKKLLEPLAPQEIIEQFNPERIRERTQGRAIEGDEGVTIERQLLEMIESSEDRLTEDELRLLQRFTTALYSKDEARVQQAREGLAIGVSEDAPRYAKELFGDVLSIRDRSYDEAQQFYAQEVVDQYPSEHLSYPGRRAVELLLQTRRLSEAVALLEDARFFAPLTTYEKIDLSARSRDFSLTAWSVFLYEWESVAFPALWLLSGIAASIWFVIIAQFAGFERGQLLRYGLAFLLGILSATLTLYVAVVQDQMYGFSANETGDILSQLIYWIAGVGLREELCKLILFAPMIPFLLRRGDGEVLVTAAMVGLGFAFSENIGYFGGLLSGLDQTTSWARFLTANFLHLALTGVVGLALVRAIRRPKVHWDNFLIDFLLVIALHGIYDAVISIEEMGDYGGLANMLSLAAIAFLFFKPLHENMNLTGAMRISPLGVFVLGSALLCGIVFCFACWGVPFDVALVGLISTVASLLPIAFLYIKEFRDL